MNHRTAPQQLYDHNRQMYKNGSLPHVNSTTMYYRGPAGAASQDLGASPFKRPRPQSPGGAVSVAYAGYPQDTAAVRFAMPGGYDIYRSSYQVSEQPMQFPDDIPAITIH